MDANSFVAMACICVDASRLGYFIRTSHTHAHSIHILPRTTVVPQLVAKLANGFTTCSTLATNLDLQGVAIFLVIALCVAYMYSFSHSYGNILQYGYNFSEIGEPLGYGMCPIHAAWLASLLQTLVRNPRPKAAVTLWWSNEILWHGGRSICGR
jgi:hypothetical protein